MGGKGQGKWLRVKWTKEAENTNSTGTGLE